MSKKAKGKSGRKRRYLGPHTPRKVPDGFVIVHNFVPTGEQRTWLGLGGFRAWGEPEENLPTLDYRVRPCDCGWAGLPHYNVVRGED
jgi:hypothetical protein